MDEFKTFLQTKYTVRDLGHAEHYVGWKIDHSRTGGVTKVSKPALAMQILEDVSMQDCNASISPYILRLYMGPICQDEPPLNTDRYPLAIGLGALRYLADCRPPRSACDLTVDAALAGV